ncbi:hypothetical protein [Azospirillum sp. TSO22-1]|uniref:hypothetical protein n=1 Tax=Azospirillum sp. TSO22-1 TaxID=716789 RepID=UPI000D61B9FA|nr:hypothetical protein [Azospirillum sp. TSO22-1]PWC37358.1 hypothetical protein TSO221_27600 [Azospirillum sp. TSO22-1]
MRTILTLTLPALLLLAAPAGAQTASRSDQMSTGSGRVDPRREVDASDVVPSRALIGKPVTYRYKGGTAGTIRDFVTGDDGRQKIVMDVKGSGRHVVLDTSEVRRQGNGVQLMIDPEQVAELPDYQNQGGMGTMGGTMGGQMGKGRSTGGTGQ